VQAYVAIIGPGSGATESDRTSAREAARRLATAGLVIVTGGLGGVMGAAAEGCATAGGTSVGLLPGRDRSSAHPALTVSLPTGLGELRNGLVVRSSDCVLAVGGSWGTTSEIALALRAGVPVVSLNGWPLPDDPGLHLAHDVDDAVAQVRDLVGRPRGT
jgi:uncharacterized protein (TIGR00725 family)